MNNNEGFYMEYEDILCHRRADFYGTYVGRESTQEELIEYLRYIFENILCWTPQQVRDHYTHELAEKLHFTRIISRLEYPIELDKEKDLFYIAVLLYPDEITYNKKERVLEYYKNVYLKMGKTNHTTFFDYWDRENYLHNCIRYMISQEFKGKDKRYIYEFFARLKKNYEPMLRRYKLTNLCRAEYEFPIDMIHEALLPEDRDDDLYALMRVHCYCKDCKIK